MRTAAAHPTRSDRRRNDRRGSGRWRRPTTALALITALIATGCGTGSGEPGGSGGASRSGSGSGGKGGEVEQTSFKSPLTWEFEHVADFKGQLADLAARTEDDIWAVATEAPQGRATSLLRYDGTRWTTEPLPGFMESHKGPLLLERIGDEALWLRPLENRPPYGQEDAAMPWAQWDGSRWTEMAEPPRGPVWDVEATGPDDVWVLDGDKNVQHWDGTDWTPTGLSHRAVDLAVAGPDDVWVVGSRDEGPGTELDYGTFSQPASSHWDGTSWKAVKTPLARFTGPMPPEPSASLGQVFVLDGGEVRAHGGADFNRGEVDSEPEPLEIQLRWDGSRWVEHGSVPDMCAQRVPLGQDRAGLFLHGNWHLTEKGECLRIKRAPLPSSITVPEGARTSLRVERLHRLPDGTWLGAGYVTTGSSDRYDAPVVVRLTSDD
ncbi:hypothetical protein JNUCC64_17580 [Streptomyces sp. JNUCC 64]